MSQLTVISGGQTGVDQAALDAARDLGLRYGGFVPNGRWTEDGPLRDDYEGMVETESRNPKHRTKRNVELADATLIVSRGPCEGGTLLTLQTAEQLGKPHLHLDLDVKSKAEATDAILAWLARTRPASLNVGGPRASKDPLIYRDIKAILLAVLDQDRRQRAQPA